MNSTQKAQSCGNTRQPIVFLRIFSECVAAQRSCQVGVILRTFPLKAVSALTTRSSIANLAAGAVDVDLQGLTLCC